MLIATGFFDRLAHLKDALFFIIPYLAGENKENVKQLYICTQTSYNKRNACVNAAEEGHDLERLYRKSELLFALAWIAAYMVLFDIANSISAAVGVAKAAAAPLGIIFVGVMIGFIKRHGMMEKYGLCAVKGRMKDFLYFIPLALLLATKLWRGVRLNASILETGLYVAFMLCIGFIEEMIYRGFLFKALCRQSVKSAIVISSLTFGISHIVQLFNGKELFLTLLQIGYATAFGYMFTMLFHRGKSMWPGIITHGVFNALSIFSVYETSMTVGLATVAGITVLCFGYGLWIAKRVPAEDAPALMEE